MPPMSNVYDTVTPTGYGCGVDVYFVEPAKGSSGHTGVAMIVSCLP